MSEHEEQASAILAESVKDNEAKRQALEVAEEARQKEYRQPSFGGKLFMGQFDPSSLFPFPLQDEQDRRIGDEYLAQLEKFLRDHLDPEEVDRTHEIPKAVFEGLARLGAFAMKIPKKYGGLGLSQVNYNRAIMLVASYCGATATLLSAHQSIGVPQPLKMYGTEAQKQKYFPRFREGAISAFALTEVDVGSDPARLSTEARLSADGSHYILNGTKLWCTNGTVANVIVVMASTEPKIVNGKEKKQISAFILEMDTPGVEVIHRCEFMGLNGIYNGMIKFTNVKIPKENLIWEEGRGLAMALATINVGRLTLPAASAGGCKQMLSIARRWGKERVQWGQPVGEHETGKNKVAFIAATTFAIEAVCLLTSKWADDAKVDIRIEAAMAKLFATESMWHVTDLTMQLRGGRGYETARSLKARGEPPYPVERAMRDCRINTILEGTSEIMKLFLAREAMDPHLNRAKDLLFGKSSIWKKVGSAFKIAGFYLKWYPEQWFRSLRHRQYDGLGPLSQYYQFIDHMSHDLARSLFYYMVKYKQKLESKQLILGRLMEIGTDLFVMAATCSYAMALYKQNPKDNTPIELADYFCTIAKRRIRRRYAALTDNDDKKGDKLAQAVLDDHVRWLEEGIMWIGPDN